jgi:very-short-patch-repair endonuclease
MSDERRAAQAAAGVAHRANLIKPAEALRRREAWKYAELELALVGRDYAFEFELEGRVFDLALLDEKVLVEFDGPDHSGEKQHLDDQQKERIAEAAGFIVVRRQVVPSTVIGVETLEGL